MWTYLGSFENWQMATRKNLARQPKLWVRPHSSVECTTDSECTLGVSVGFFWVCSCISGPTYALRPKIRADTDGTEMGRTLYSAPKYPNIPRRTERGTFKYPKSIVRDHSFTIFVISKCRDASWIKINSRMKLYPTVKNTWCKIYTPRAESGLSCIWFTTSLPHHSLQSTQTILI